MIHTVKGFSVVSKAEVDVVNKISFSKDFSSNANIIYSFGKKGAQRSRHRGGAVRLASSRARAALPYVPHPAALTMALEHLNLHPEHSKNVPIFAMQG